MPLCSQQSSAQRRAVTNVLDLLGMANSAVHRACAQLSGEAVMTALSIAAQLDALRDRAQDLARLLENAEQPNNKEIVPAAELYARQELGHHDTPISTFQVTYEASVLGGLGLPMNEPE